jgi:uncharacterized protein
VTEPAPDPLTLPAAVAGKQLSEPASQSIAKTPDRYELLIDGELAVFADYVVHGDVMELPHTVTNPAFRGRGLAAVLVSHILDELRSVDARVIPSCSYVATFIDRHPEYQPLLRR